MYVRSLGTQKYSKTNGIPILDEKFLISIWFSPKLCCQEKQISGKVGKLSGVKKVS